MSAAEYLPRLGDQQLAALLSGFPEPPLRLRSVARDAYPALAVSGARIDAAAVLREGDLLSRVLDTFVTAQLRPGRSVRTRRTDLGVADMHFVVESPSALTDV